MIMLWFKSPNKFLPNEKVVAVFIAVFVVAAGAGLATLFDSQKLLWFLPALAVILAGINFWFPETRRAVWAFGLWCAYGIIFGLRALQVVPLWVVIIFSITLTALAAIIWFAKGDAWLLFLLTIEFVVVSLFSPAAFLVSASLVILWLWIMAAFIEQVRTHTLTARRLVTQLISAAGVVALFIIAFPWVL